MPVIGGGKRRKTIRKSTRPARVTLKTTQIRLSHVETRRILINIFLVSFAFMLLFTANQGVLNLQSSINPEYGTISLAVIFASLAISCMLLPTFLIKKLGAKYTLVLGMSCYAPYIAFQLYPKVYTLIPTAIILGVGAAPMWSALSTYLTHLGQVYATMLGLQVDTIIVRFFGFFYFAWQGADVWGNLVSGLVINEPEINVTTPAPNETSPAINETIAAINETIAAINETSDADLEYCGPNFCPGRATKYDRPPESEIFILIMIFLPCIALALIIIIVLLDPLKRYGENREGSQNPNELTTLNLLLSTSKILARPNLILLIPITIWIGMEQGFIAANYTRAFVACIIGVHKIGYVMICFGICDAVCSLSLGIAMQYVGRLPIVAVGAVAHYTVLIILLKWHPHFGGPLLFYILAGVYGLGDAVWQTQINGLYGTIFRRHKEAAFANYRLFESVGFIIAYSTTNALCANTKIYMLIGILSIGVLGYLGVELRLFLRKRKFARRGYGSTSKDNTKPSDAKPMETLQPEDISNEEDDEHDALEKDIVVTKI